MLSEANCNLRNGTEQDLGHQTGECKLKNKIYLLIYIVVTLKSLFKLEIYKKEHLKSYLHK